MSDESLKSWDLPDITEDGTPEESRRNALNKPLRWRYEPPESDREDGSDDDEHAPMGMTAEALEAIREAARLEGFEEGRKEGLETGHKEGFDAGYADGEKAGREAGEKAASETAAALQQQLSERWEVIIEALRQPTKLVDEALEKQLIHMVMELARAVCWQEVTQNPEIVREALKRGIQDLGMSSQRVEIHVNPEDFMLIDSRWDEKTRTDKGWFVYSDEAVSRGGCRIQTPLAEIDTSLEARMAEVFENLLNGLGSATPVKKSVAEPSATSDTSSKATPNVTSNTASTTTPITTREAPPMAPSDDTHDNSEDSDDLSNTD
ncbi:MAG: flagellar assembly protein FliH [Idiomarina sp.]|nr:flagellar assembly protein FliH [Idiomarina sp.]